MFWTNDKHPAIKKAGLDGSDPVVLVSTDIQLPKAITVDKQAVYWSDVRKETIESVNQDGTNRKILVKSTYTLGIGILDQYIYYSCPHANYFVLQVNFFKYLTVN